MILRSVVYHTAPGHDRIFSPFRVHAALPHNAEKTGTVMGYGIDGLVRRGLNRLRRWGPAGAKGDDYARRLAAEQSTFRDVSNVHELPDIFHYWSHTYIAPKFNRFGFAHPDDFFAKHLQEAAAHAAGRTARFISIGAGNCDTEVRLAVLLKSRGIADFTLECVDINADMLARGRVMAAQMGVQDQVIPVAGDFNDWRSARGYDAVIANQSLHHVVNLEGLYDAIGAALHPHGIFATSDMIGRNGHQRWPEARAIVDEFWAELPPAYRYNRLLRRQEESFLDWDCATSGFEGVRAQDVLPLLVERFEFDLFLPFGNVVDPFVDRCFGHNFDATAEWDRRFIDRVHARDEQEIARGAITPTHMLAVLRASGAGRRECLDGLSPAACVRRA
jgi:SAM-dependent methyltransferase